MDNITQTGFEVAPDPSGHTHALESITNLRLRELAATVGVSSRTWLRWVSQGNAPQPIRLGENVVAWRLTDVRQWLATRSAA